MTPTNALAELEAKAQTTGEKARKSGERLLAQQARRRDLEAALADLARREPGEFSEAGSPLGAAAKKLQRAQAIENELAQATGANAIELVRGLVPDAEAAREKLYGAPRCGARGHGCLRPGAPTGDDVHPTDRNQWPSHPIR